MIGLGDHMTDFVQLANFIALSIPVFMVGLLAYQILEGRHGAGDRQGSKDLESDSLDHPSDSG
jgi:hypothetical protein